MNQVQNQLIVKNPSDSITSAYCKRNNINERQFKKAKAWYHSAMQSSNQEKKNTLDIKLISICFTINLEF